jgi:PAS domain S-box-containing protein
VNSVLRQLCKKPRWVSSGNGIQSRQEEAWGQGAAAFTGSLPRHCVKRQRDNFFAEAFRPSPHPIGITELETGACLEVNDACLATFDFRRDEVIGKTTLMLRIWPDSHDRARLIDRLKCEGSVRNFDVSIRMNSGELRQFLISADLITLRRKPCILTIGNDITDRKRLWRSCVAPMTIWSDAFRNGQPTSNEPMRRCGIVRSDSVCSSSMRRSRLRCLIATCVIWRPAAAL